MKKRRIKIKPILFLISIVLIVILNLSFNTNNEDNTLYNLGYDKSEINEINKLSDYEIDTIKKNKYNKNLINLIKNKEYNSKNIENYLKYLYDYKNVDSIIKYVNDYSNLDVISINFMDEKYFIEEYLERYLNYYKSNNLDYNEIIKRVNSNLDYKFYTDSKEADTSKGMYTLVNKFNYLKSDYVPKDLVNVDKKYKKYDRETLLNKDAYNAFLKMASELEKNNLFIKITTAYRSYSFQNTLYTNYVNQDGQTLADTYSARPGYSEHQLGYSIDVTDGINTSFDNFKNTNEYKWLYDNAHKYGFILRYTDNNEYITGYIKEEWHYRYVGVDIATYIYENNLTYEEYYAYFLR